MRDSANHAIGCANSKSILIGAHLVKATDNLPIG